MSVQYRQPEMGPISGLIDFAAPKTSWMICSSGLVVALLR